MRLSPSLGISPRWHHRIPTMTNTCCELQVQDGIVRCWTFRKWRYGGQCHFGCSFIFFSSLQYFVSWISAKYKLRLHRILPPQVISQVEVEFPHVPNPVNHCHTAVIRCGTSGLVYLCTLNCCLIVFFPSYSCKGICSIGGLHLTRGIM